MHLPDVRIVNFLDDGIVADIERAGGVVPEQVINRLFLLGRAAVQAGADAVLLTCSSISQTSTALSEQIGVPVFRIDEAMADAVVAAGPMIAVVATLPTTLEPTCALIQERAELAGVEVTITRALCREAFDLVSAGDGEGHDRVIRETVSSLSDEVDVVVLAQASMARALQGVDFGTPVLASPELGMLRMREMLAKLAEESR
jgi:Asp/Glu/hydantoin racemase